MRIKILRITSTRWYHKWVDKTLLIKAQVEPITKNIGGYLVRNNYLYYQGNK
jgi:hypothetical protein